MNKDTKIDLTPERAAGMTVNERLYLSGLLNDFDRAIGEKNERKLRLILREIYFRDEDIDFIIEELLGN